jgi:hypothetical protein
MERNDTPLQPPTERRLLDLAAETVRSALPVTWETTLRDAAKPLDAQLVMTAPDGRTTTLQVEAKSILDARDVPALQARWSDVRDRGAGTGLAVARYLSPRTRQALADAGVSYVDATGNVRLATDEPALFVLLAGADRDPWRTPDRPTNSLRGKPAARIVRTLVDRARPWKIRELAGAAGTSLGSTSRTVDFLAREALVTRNDAGAIVDVHWPELLERWGADYDLTRRRSSVGLLAPRGLDSLRASLAEMEDRYAISGSMAAALWAPYAEPKLALVYATDIAAAQRSLGLREAPSRPNVLLIEPENDYVFMRSIERDGLTYAAPSQVAVDLLAGPGRNPAEGRELIRWMQDNEESWRAS